MTEISQPQLNRNGETDDPAPVSNDELKVRVVGAFDELMGLVDGRVEEPGPLLFRVFEREVQVALWKLGCAIVVLFLARREAYLGIADQAHHEGGGRRFRRAPAQARNLTTLFGVVRYWRVYMREVAAKDRRGFHPLDAALGLLADRFSLNVLTVAVRLATKLSFAEARTTLQLFIPVAPSTEVVEQTVLGMGRQTGSWFERAAAPEGDGEVMVIMFDSKGAPTATDSELARRRGKRRGRPRAASPRHRGRARRSRYPKKPRRNKGDKSKNAKMATMFVMYTLKRKGTQLLGPINKRVYASFAPKVHAFQIARREADKRGFQRGSGRTIQIVTDGDNDLAVYANDYFPEAVMTIDVVHVIEKLWSAGESIHDEGSAELHAWMDEQKQLLYAGAVDDLLVGLMDRLAEIPRTGPGNKGRRERLDNVIHYIDKRRAKMNYGELLGQDLEISTGMMEGAIKNVIGKRCDHGGMRWIKERVEALLQLRCIEMNGDWDAFTSYVETCHYTDNNSRAMRTRLQSPVAAPLPSTVAAS